MDLISRFIEQRSAFEQSYKDDDWSRLVAFYDEDAVYEVMAMPFHCVVKGRTSILNGFQKAVTNFDRHCERTVWDNPKVSVEGTNVVVVSGITMTHGDSPPIHTALTEITTYQDDRIVRMIDLYAPDESAKYEAWMQNWGAGLDPSYV